MPGRVGGMSDRNADKIEKSRRGNALDGKRRGPAVGVLSNRFQEDFPSAGTVTQLEMEGQGLGEAQDSRLSSVVLKQPRVLAQQELWAWEEPG